MAERSLPAYAEVDVHVSERHVGIDCVVKVEQVFGCRSGDDVVVIAVYKLAVILITAVIYVYG